MPQVAQETAVELVDLDVLPAVGLRALVVVRDAPVIAVLLVREIVMEVAHQDAGHAQLLAGKTAQEAVVGSAHLVVHQHAALDAFLPVKRVVL